MKKNRIRTVVNAINLMGLSRFDSEHWGKRDDKVDFHCFGGVTALLYAPEMVTWRPIGRSFFLQHIDCVYFEPDPMYDLIGEILDLHRADVKYLTSNQIPDLGELKNRITEITNIKFG